jgi:hypothetical protein
VGFHTGVDSPVTEAVFTHQVISPGPTYPRSNLTVETRITERSVERLRNAAARKQAASTGAQT